MCTPFSRKASTINTIHFITWQGIPYKISTSFLSAIAFKYFAPYANTIITLWDAYPIKAQKRD